MRAGPLSDDRIIKTLNTYFVPYYVTFEDYWTGTNGVPKEEAEEFQKIMAEFRKTKFSGGTVHAYVFTADRVPLGSLHVAEASKLEVLRSFLSGFVSKLSIAPAAPSFAPRPQSVPPAAGKDSVVVHVFIRGITIVKEFPHEDWIVFTPQDVQRLLASGSQKSETTWWLDRTVAAKFGERLHPTLQWLVAEPDGSFKTRIDNLDIKATMLTSNENVSVAKLEGKLKMLRTAYGYDPDKSTVRANLSGYIRFKDKRILALELVVKDAFYGDGGLSDKEFEGYVEAVPEPARLKLVSEAYPQ